MDVATHNPFSFFNCCLILFLAQGHDYSSVVLVDDLCHGAVDGRGAAEDSFVAGQHRHGPR